MPRPSGASTARGGMAARRTAAREALERPSHAVPVTRLPRRSAGRSRPRARRSPGRRPAWRRRPRGPRSARSSGRSRVTSTAVSMPCFQRSSIRCWKRVRCSVSMASSSCSSWSARSTSLVMMTSAALAIRRCASCPISRIVACRSRVRPSPGNAAGPASPRAGPGRRSAPGRRSSAGR